VVADYKFRVSNAAPTGRMGGLSVVVALACVAAALPASSAGQVRKPLDAIEGALVQAGGGKVAVKSEGKEVALAARSSYLLHTLEDKRLAGREVRIEGVRKPDGSFEAWRFLTVRDGKLFRVRYYCDVCNIEALEPGRCVCCQRPTELQEIPVDQAEP
jgi:uncharacterized protein (DUF2147 family)